MTDNEIIKAFECCDVTNDCESCPIRGLVECLSVEKHALDLINRQKAEIESLAKKYEMAVAEREANVKGFAAEIERLEKDRKENFEMWKKLCEQTEEKHEKMFQEAKATIRPKAIKEFAERLKQYLLLTKNGQMSVISFENINCLVKEMVGEDG